MLRKFGYAMLGVLLLGAVGCATAHSGNAPPGSPGCTDAPLDGPDWKAVGGKFTPEDKDKCGRTVAGTFWLAGQGASFEKSVPHMTPASTWYLEANVVTSCAEVAVVAGSPGGGLMPGKSMGGNRYAAAGYVQSSELAVAVLFKNSKAGCDAKISSVHITPTPPAGMEALPPAPGAPTSPTTPR